MNKFLLISALALTAAVGCQDQKKPANSASALDLTPTPAAPVYTAPAPTPVQPVTYDIPVTSTPAANSTAMLGGSYTVKKGDTLYSIAKKKYGDGKQWSRIASANPGLSPSSLKVGQAITLP